MERREIAKDVENRIRRLGFGKVKSKGLKETVKKVINSAPKWAEKIDPEEVNFEEVLYSIDIGTLKYLPSKDFKKLVDIETGKVVDVSKYGKIVNKLDFDYFDTSYLAVLEGATPLLIVETEDGKKRLVDIERDKLLLETDNIEVSQNLMLEENQVRNLFVVAKNDGKLNLYAVRKDNNLQYLTDLKDEKEAYLLLIEEIGKEQTFEITDSKGVKHTLLIKADKEDFEIYFDNQRVDKPTYTVVSHPAPRHLDDTLALHLLGSLYNAQYKFVHPQGDEVKEYIEDPTAIVVDIGGEYDPQKLNFDHHQDLNLPSSVVLTLKHFKPSLLEDETVKEFVEIADKIDRFGFPKVSKEYNLPPDNTVPLLMRAYLDISQKLFEEGKVPFKNPEQFKNHLKEALSSKYPIKVITEEGQTVEALFDVEKEKIEGAEIDKEGLSKVVPKIKAVLIKGRVPVVDFSDIVSTVREGKVFNPVLDYMYQTQKKTFNPESFKNPYNRFFLKAVVQFPKAVVNDYVNRLKEEEKRKKEVLSNLKIATFMGLKAIIDLSDNPLRPGEYFQVHPDAGFLFQRNAFNKEQTSIVKNTRLPETQKINLNELYKILGEDKKVFTHPTGFITVVDMPVEETLQKLKKELSNDISLNNDTFLNPSF